jgi:hypothetical protein
MAEVCDLSVLPDQARFGSSPSDAVKIESSRLLKAADRLAAVPRKGRERMH